MQKITRMSAHPNDLAHTPSKAVIHCDVDCFYCQVETRDNPALAGRPLAVHQGNSGGFVAVNYEVGYDTYSPAYAAQPQC